MSIICSNVFMIPGIKGKGHRANAICVDILSNTFSQLTNYKRHFNAISHQTQVSEKAMLETGI